MPFARNRTVLASAITLAAQFRAFGQRLQQRLQRLKVQPLFDELRTWQHSDHLERLDLTYSRDGHPQCYVQDVLRDATSTLLAWLTDSAAIYLCGTSMAWAAASTPACANCSVMSSWNGAAGVVVIAVICIRAYPPVRPVRS